MYDWFIRYQGLSRALFMQSLLNCIPIFRTFVGGSHFETCWGTAPYVSAADYITFSKDNSDGLVTCSIHGTNLLSKNYHSGF